MRNLIRERWAKRLFALRHLAAATMLFGTLSVEAKAQSCAQYPPGPQRFACASQLHPGLVAKQQRCKDEAERMGLRSGVGGGGGALKDYVMACMQRH